MEYKKVIYSVEQDIGKRRNLSLNLEDIKRRAFYLDDANLMEITFDNDAIPVKTMDLDNFQKGLEKTLQRFLETTDMPINKDKVESISDLETLELQEHIKYTTGLQTTIHYLGYLPEFDDSVLVYDKENNVFAPLDKVHFETAQVYKNWQEIINPLHYEVTTTEVEYGGCVILDEYDGNNFTTGGVDKHQHVSITSLDGEAPYNDDYLVIHTLQWQGVPEAEIMDREALKKHLDKYGIDVGKYMKEIDDEHDHVELMMLKRDADFDEDIRKLERYGDL